VEILNQIILAGNLTDQPSVSDAGGRQFVRARLVQNWFYDTQGRTVEHRQFLPITFFGESAIVAKTFQKGDNIHVTGQLIRREPRPRADGESAAVNWAPYTRFMSFALSASPPTRNRKRRPSTKTRFAAPMTQSRFRHFFRRVFMIGLSSLRLRSAARAFSRLSCVIVPIGIAALGIMFAWVGFGLVFNYTHSVPFGIYREIADPASTPHNPAPYVFFCPDVRWPRMKGQPNYRDPMRTCPDGFSPLIKPVVAWPATR